MGSVGVGTDVGDVTPPASQCNSNSNGYIVGELCSTRLCANRHSRRVRSPSVFGTSVCTAPTVRCTETSLLA